MRYKTIPSSLFVNNRKRFTKELKPGSVAIHRLSPGAAQASVFD
jgi:hypothetical protein